MFIVRTAKLQRCQYLILENNVCMIVCLKPFNSAFEKEMVQKKQLSIQGE